MSRRPLLRAGGVAALCVAASFGLFRAGPIGSTFAVFNAETENASSAFAGGWLDTPTTLAVATSGSTATLTWNAGTHGSTSEVESISGAATATNGTSTTCPTTLSAIATPAWTTGTDTYTDTGRLAMLGGEHFCYRVTPNAGTYWTGTAASLVTQFPFYAYSLALTNSNNTIAAGDTITITFDNNPTAFSTSGGKLNVCAWRSSSGNKLILGDPATCTGNGDTGSLGTLVLSGGKTVAGNVSFLNSTYTLANGVMAISLVGGATTTVTGTGTPTWTFTPNSTLVQIGSVAVCTTTTTCTPSTTSTF
jgi:hypothetical protein